MNITPSELLRIADAPIPTRFGRWTYDPRLMTLTHTIGYEIDLERFTNSAECLDFIFQATAKSWIISGDVFHLIEAIRILVNPQANLCSFGTERGPFDAKSRLSCLRHLRVEGKR